MEQDKLKQEYITEEAPSQDKLADNLDAISNEIVKLEDSIKRGNQLLTKITEMNTWIRSFAWFGDHIKEYNHNELLAQEIRDKLVTETQDLMKYTQMKIDILGKYYLGRK